MGIFAQGLLASVWSRKLPEKAKMMCESFDQPWILPSTSWGK